VSSVGATSAQARPKNCIIPTHSDRVERKKGRGKPVRASLQKEKRGENLEKGGKNINDGDEEALTTRVIYPGDQGRKHNEARQKSGLVVEKKNQGQGKRRGRKLASKEKEKKSYISCPWHLSESARNSNEGRHPPLCEGRER